MAGGGEAGDFPDLGQENGGGLGDDPRNGGQPVRRGPSPGGERASSIVWSRSSRAYSSPAIWPRSEARTFPREALALPA